MRIPLNVALVLAGLITGCGAGAVATHRAVAQTETAPPSSSTRGQQYCEELRLDPQELNALLAQRGADGWELAALPFTSTGQGFTGALCFKRPLPAGRFTPSTL